MVVFNEEKEEKKFDELRKEEEENLARVLSAKFGVSYIDLTTVSVNMEALRVIDEPTARDAKMGVFDVVAKKIKVAVLAPESDKTIKVLEDLKSKGFIPTIYMASMASLNKIWNRYKDLSFSFETRSGALDISNDEIKEFMKDVHSLADVKGVIDQIIGQKKGYKISRLLEIIIAGALALNASDVHVEPEEKRVRIRYRLDGVLTEIVDITDDIFNLLLSRIKLLSGMKLNVGGAQDGRFSIILSDIEIEIRSSVLPGSYGNSVVLRVLNPNSISVPLEELGIPKKLLSIIEHEISKPEGMILTTGPTGSGKTTTLYAFLRKIFSQEVKIITIENPIEYHLQGIVQTQTDTKTNYTFLEGLRSALRQDPDIIMVGEIRDSETAEIAVNAALTGHLVFSTLHTNNAAGTFPRLIDLGVNPKVITSALSISMAQRLVRKLCPKCKKKVTLEGRSKQIIDRVLSKITQVEEHLETIPNEIYEPAGCADCNFTGYKGRIGIYEAVLRDEAVEKVVISNPSEREIWKAAAKQGILNMQQDGVIKILQGITSLHELERVVDLEQDYW